MQRKIIVVDEPSEKGLVVKSNYLIEAPYRLSLQEQRIVFLMISIIKADDKDFSFYRFSIKYFQEMVGVKGEGSYDKLKAITIKLRKRDLIIHRPDGSELQTGWVSSADYMPGEGCVELCFDPKLKPYLLGLKEFFTKYSLDNVLSLRKAYSIRMYEILKQYENIGDRTLKVNTLKEILGIQSHEYKLYGHLKNKVLLPTQKEISKRTDIRFEFDEIKNGRKVVSIKFIIKPNEAKAAPKEKKELKGVNLELYLRLQSFFCLSPRQAKKVIKSYDETYISEHLTLIERDYHDGKIKKLAPYTLKALKEDFRPKKSGFDLEKEQKQQQRENQKRDKERLDRLQIEYDRAIKTAGTKLLDALSEPEKERWIKDFEQEKILPYPGMITMYRERGLTSGIFRSQFENYLVSRNGAPELKNLIAFARSRGIQVEQNEKGEYRMIEGAV